MWGGFVMIVIHGVESQDLGILETSRCSKDTRGRLQIQDPIKTQKQVTVTRKMTMAKL